MPHYKITTDLFTVPCGEGQTVIYAPLTGFVCQANADLLALIDDLENLSDRTIRPEQRPIIDYLISKGVVNGPQVMHPKTKHDVELSPAKLTLFPTNQCNLACRYCYAASDRADAMTMNWDIAAGSIGYFISLMKKEQRDIFPLEFHGGGEPFVAWDLVRRIITLAEQQCEQHGFILKATSSTNGVLDERKLKWIVNHFSFLLISFDVLPRVQDYHRETIHGNGSFERVHRTLRFLDQREFPYGIRCTVSRFNEDWLDETVDFVMRNYGTKWLFLEPVSICGSCAGFGDELKPDMNKFIEYFQRLEPICAARGLRLEYSGACLEKITPTFCYVGTDNFAVTPDGYLTNCWQVSSNAHPLADTFIFGRMNSDGSIAVDQEKLNFLRTLSVDQLNYCQDCFAKWHCAGDCVVRLGHGQPDGPRGGERCETTRQILAHRILHMLEIKSCYENI